MYILWVWTNVWVRIHILHYRERLRCANDALFPHLFLLPTLNPWKSLAFYCLQSFAFPRCRWNHIMRNLFTLTNFPPLSNMHFHFSHVCSWLDSLFYFSFLRFFLMWTIFKIFIHFLKLSFSCFMFCFVFVNESFGILAPWPRIKLTPTALEGEILTTEPLGESPSRHFAEQFSYIILGESIFLANLVMYHYIVAWHKYLFSRGPSLLPSLPNFSCIASWYLKC